MILLQEDVLVATRISAFQHDGGQDYFNYRLAQIFWKIDRWKLSFLTIKISSPNHYNEKVNTIGKLIRFMNSEVLVKDNLRTTTHEFFYNVMVNVN